MILNVTFKETDKIITAEFKETYRISDGSYDTGYKQGYQQGVSDTIPTGIINITENGTYDVTKAATAKVNIKTPEGYIIPTGTININKVGNYDVTQYANASFSVYTETKTITPTKSIQYYSVPEGYISGVTVKPIPDAYIIPSDVKNINENGIHNISQYASVNVNVPIPEGYIRPAGKIDITTPNEVDVTNYAVAQIVDENLKAENIAENIEIFGITGTFRGGIDTSDATATSADILLGKTAYVNEQKVEGSIESYNQYEINIPTIDGMTLNTKNKYVKDDIALTIGIPRYRYETDKEVVYDIDSFIQGQITEYYNSRVTEVKTGFSNNNIIKKVDLPNVVVVGNRVFSSSENLTTINIPKAETLGIAAFSSTTSLENALLWNVTTTSNQCFQSSGIKILIAPKLQSVATQFCNGASKLEIAVLDNITSMQGGMGFYNCKELKAVIIKQDNVVPPLTTNVFQASSVASGTGFVYVPDSKIEEYKVATNWSSIANQIKPLSEIPQEILNRLEELGYGN